MYQDRMVYQDRAGEEHSGFLLEGLTLTFRCRDFNQSKFPSSESFGRKWCVSKHLKPRKYKASPKIMAQVQEQERYIEVPVERISYKDVEVTVEFDRYDLLRRSRAACLFPLSISPSLDPLSLFPFIPFYLSLPQLSLPATPCSSYFPSGTLTVCLSQPTFKHEFSCRILLPLGLNLRLAPSCGHHPRLTTHSLPSCLTAVLILRCCCRYVQVPVQVVRQVEVVKEIPIEVVKEVERIKEVYRDVPVEVVREQVPAAHRLPAAARR